MIEKVVAWEKNFAAPEHYFPPPLEWNIISSPTKGGLSGCWIDLKTCICPQRRAAAKKSINKFQNKVKPGTLLSPCSSSSRQVSPITYRCQLSHGTEEERRGKGKFVSLLFSKTVRGEEEREGGSPPTYLEWMENCGKMPVSLICKSTRLSKCVSRGWLSLSQQNNSTS